MKPSEKIAMVFLASVLLISFQLFAQPQKEHVLKYSTFYRTINMDGISIFYREFEKRLVESRAINVRTITLEGDANGTPHPEPSSYSKKFTGKYSHRTITGGIGHNLPHEAPQAFAQAICEVDEFKNS
jgi:pimeloyl-ACP methyl ester carboxylesterase